MIHYNIFAAIKKYYMLMIPGLPLYVKEQVFRLGLANETNTCGISTASLK